MVVAGAFGCPLRIRRVFAPSVAQWPTGAWIRQPCWCRVPASKTTLRSPACHRLRQLLRNRATHRSNPPLRRARWVEKAGGNGAARAAQRFHSDAVLPPRTCFSCAFDARRVDVTPCMIATGARRRRPMEIRVWVGAQIPPIRFTASCRVAPAQGLTPLTSACASHASTK